MAYPLPQIGMLSQEVRRVQYGQTDLGGGLRIVSSNRLGDFPQIPHGSRAESGYGLHH